MKLTPIEGLCLLVTQPLTEDLLEYLLVPLAFIVRKRVCDGRVSYIRKVEPEVQARSIDWTTVFSPSGPGQLDQKVGGDVSKS